VSVTLFVNSPTGQTSQWIFTVDSLKDADLRKDVPFGGSRWWLITFRDPKYPTTPKSVNRHFKPNMQKIQLAISSDLCIRLTWNLTGSCGQQQRLRGWSRMVVKQFQDADGRHFENHYIAISQWKIIRFWWNFVHSSRFWTGCTRYVTLRLFQMKKLHWTDSEFDITYFLITLPLHKMHCTTLLERHPFLLGTPMFAEAYSNGVLAILGGVCQGQQTGGNCKKK